MNYINRMELQINQYESKLEQNAKQFHYKIKSQKAVEWLSQAEPLLIQIHQLLHQEYGQLALVHKPIITFDASSKEVMDYENALEKDMARMRLQAFGQGFFLAKNNRRMVADVPLQLFLSSRVISRMAHSYGFTLDSPFESMYAMRLLNYSLLPNHVKRAEWELLFMEVIEHEQGQPFYRVKDDVINEEIVYAFALQSLKWGLVNCINYTKVPGKRLAAGMVSSTSSYRQVQTVIRDAQRFYQKRWLWRRT
ncbi:EcsC family protein [Shouchella patagoniensis]|uniref:EcsC family protein n=1 Tax=Shouchella patagoniensis TaxID=228576 RepID=UPI001474B948|nr:EcsC family protein [Shouchella patagoniensis]